jgi:hypothetical protein
MKESDTHHSLTLVVERLEWSTTAQYALVTSLLLEIETPNHTDIIAQRRRQCRARHFLLLCSLYIIPSQPTTKIQMSYLRCWGFISYVLIWSVICDGSSLALTGVVVPCQQRQQPNLTIIEMGLWEGTMNTGIFRFRTCSCHAQTHQGRARRWLCPHRSR